MIKNNFYIIFVLFFLSSCLTQKHPVKSIIKEFENENSKVMIVAHRANITDTLPENSMEGILKCIEFGIDIIEIDVQRTKDNVLIVMHDETLNRMTNGTGKIHEKNWSEIKDLKLRVKSFGKLTEYTIPTLEEVFTKSKGKIMINVDKGFWYLNEVSDLAMNLGVSKQIILKSYEPKSKIDEMLGFFPAVYFMPIILETEFNNVDNIPEYMIGHKNEIPKAFELIFDSMDDYIAQKEFMKSLKNAGIRVWVNSLSDRLCGGHGESENTEENWGFLIDNGVNIIQTDKPIELKNFLKKTYNQPNKTPTGQ